MPPRNKKNLRQLSNYKDLNLFLVQNKKNVLRKLPVYILGFACLMLGKKGKKHILPNGGGFNDDFPWYNPQKITNKTNPNTKTKLVGGFNPSEKIARQIGSNPQGSG